MKSIHLTLVALLSLTSIVAQTYITNTTIVDIEKQKLIPNQTLVPLGTKYILYLKAQKSPI
ncbi:MAG: hypothetical protein RQ735_12215 [Flavobacteriaceae bacterium]|nr:hypothetical protein [Flavobacteriaceae bacterium]